LSVAIVTFCYFYVIVFGKMSYHTNDDLSIARYISRFVFGEVWWISPWVSVILSYPLGILSALFPQIPWWFTASHVFTLFGMITVHYVMLRMGQIKSVPLWQMLVALGIFDGIFNLSCIEEIAFTIVPLVLGSGLIALVFFYPYVTPVQQKRIIVAVVIGAIVAVSHRRQSGMIMIVFLLIAIASVLSKEHGFLRWKMLLRFLVSAVVLCSIILSITCLNRYINRIAQGQEWMEFSPARSAFIDYDNDPFESNPALYEAVEWDADTYAFAIDWVFLSDEITTESLRYIVDNSRSNHSNQSIVKNFKSSMIKLIEDKGILIPLANAILICVICFCFILRKKNSNSLTCILLTGLACGVVLAYLTIISTRVLFRTVFIIIYPTVVISMLLAMESYQKEESRTFRGVMRGLLIVAVVIYVVSMCNLTLAMVDRRSNKVEQEFQQVAMYRYQNTNTDKTFITQGSAGTSYKLPTIPISNANGMGGSVWKSNYIKHFQEVNGIDVFNWTVFEKDHVYYLGMLDDDTARCVDFLQREYDCLGIAVLEKVNGHLFYCMKMVYADNLDDFDTYMHVENGKFIEVNNVTHLPDQKYP